MKASRQIYEKKGFVTSWTRTNTSESYPANDPYSDRDFLTRFLSQKETRVSGTQLHGLTLTAMVELPETLA